jgi:CcmD family protein
MSQLLYSEILFQEGKPQVTGDVGSGLIYLVAAYAVVWLFIFGYLYSLNRRQAKLRQEIDRMKQEEAERQEPFQQEQEEESQPASSWPVGG